MQHCLCIPDLLTKTPAPGLHLSQKKSNLKLFSFILFQFKTKNNNKKTTTTVAQPVFVGLVDLLSCGGFNSTQSHIFVLKYSKEAYFTSIKSNINNILYIFLYC